MATRNERKRKAKERALAIEEALKPSPVEVTVWRPKQDVFDIPKAIRGHREPTQRLGSIVKGKFTPALQKEPAKRDLVFHPVQGRMVEIAKRYYGGKR